MNYKFPIIRTIDDVLPAIAGRDEFNHYIKDGYSVVNYNVVFPDSFPDPATAPDAETSNLWALRRECRGLLFNADGTVLARRFHKFFNVNEKEETQSNVVSLDNLSVLEKLDGSMISFSIMNGELVAFTKAGITDIANDALEFANNLSTKGLFEEFIRDCIACNCTAIFEFCSRKNRVVIDHPVDRLVLTAIRSNLNGNYSTYTHMMGFAVAYKLELVKKFDDIFDINLWTETVSNETGLEGYVIRYDNGHMLKAKNEWYLQIHRAKDRLNEEKNVVEMILNNLVDDVKPHLPDYDRRRLDKYELGIESAVHAMAHELTTFVEKAKIAMKDVPIENHRKIFATEHVAKYKGEKGLLFKVYEGKPAFEEVRMWLLKQTGTRAKLEYAREILDFPVWNEYHE